MEEGLGESKPETVRRVSLFRSLLSVHCGSTDLSIHFFIIHTFWICIRQGLSLSLFNYKFSKPFVIVGLHT